MTRAGRCFVALLAAAPLAPRASESVAVVAVAPPPGPTPTLVELTAQLRQALARRTEGVLEPAQLRARMGASGGSSLSDTERAYQAARSAELARDPERAVAGLRATIKDLEALPPSEESFKQWTRAMLRLGRLESDLEGHEGQARAVLEQLLRSAPAVDVDPALYPPDFVRQFGEVKRRLAAMPRRRLTVSSTAAGVRVHVNGRFVGEASNAPVSIQVVPGRYVVAGVRGQLRAPPTTVTVGERDETVTLDFSVADLLRPDLGPGLAIAPLDRTRVITAGGFLRVDLLFACNLIEDEGASYLVGSVYDIPAGRLKLSGILRLYDQAPPVNGVEALADFLMTGREAPSRVVRPFDPLRPDPKTAFPPATPAQGPPTSKALGWVAFTTGVATLGLGGISVWQGISASHRYSDAHALLNPDGTLPASAGPSYAQLLSDGDSARRTAIITGVGAGACAAATVVLGYIAYRQTHEIGPFRF